MTTKTATLLKVKSPNTVGAVQHVYKVEPPMPVEDGKTARYVVASAVMAWTPDGDQPECYLFPSDKDGEVTDWLELPGSYRGGLDHAEALRGAGYTVA